MGDQESIVSPRLREKVAEAFRHPLRGLVLSAVVERPGATIAEVAKRLDRPARSVRHNLEWLVEQGLVGVDRETPKRGTRVRHYAAAVKLTAFDEDDPYFAEDEHRNLRFTVARMLVDDLRRAIADQTYAGRPGQSGIRVPGVVDEAGWRRLSAIMNTAMVEVMETMEESAARLQSEGVQGTEVITALLFFERAWEGGPGTPPYATLWLEHERRRAPRSTSPDDQ